MIIHPYQVLQLRIHDVNLLFYHLVKALCWIENWWLWRPFKCHVQESSLRLSQLCHTAYYPEGGRTVVVQGQTRQQLFPGVVFKWRSSGPKGSEVYWEVSPTPSCCHHQSEPLKPKWKIKVFMLSMLSSDPTIWMLQLKSRLVRQDGIFPTFFGEPVWHGV